MEKMSAIKFFVAGQIGFFFFMLIAIVISPEGLLVNRGFSYYGDSAKTVIFYILSFFSTGFFTFLSGLTLPKRGLFVRIRQIFFLFLPLLLGVILTTSFISPAPILDRFHVPLGIIIFLLQLSFANWLTEIKKIEKTDQCLFNLLILGGAISLLSLVQIIPILIEGQMIFLLAFSFIVIRTLSELNNTVH